MKKDHMGINGSKEHAVGRRNKVHWVAQNLPYVFFLIFLAMVYIANAHWTEKKVRKINSLKKEIRELNASYMSVKSDVIYQATYSELQEQVADLKLSNEGSFPVKIKSKP